MPNSIKHLPSTISKVVLGIGLAAGLLFAAAPSPQIAIDNGGQPGSRFAELLPDGPPLLQSYYVHERNTDSLLVGGDITDSAKIVLYLYSDPDPVYCVERCIKSAKVYLRFDVNGSDGLFDNGKTSFNTAISLSVVKMDSWNSSLGSVTKTLQVGASVDSISPEQWYIYDITSDHPNNCDNSGNSQFERVEIDLTSVTLPGGALNDSLRFEARLVEEYAVQARKSGSPDDRLVSPVQATSQHPMVFAWQNIDCANDSFPNYQFQLLRLFNLDTANRHTPQTIKTVVDWDKALTLETYGPRQEMTLTVAEGTGFYIWRVRPIGDWYDGGIANDSNWGVWSWSPPDDTMMTITYSGGTSYTPSQYKECLVYYTQFDDTLNFIYGRVFSEGQNSVPGISESINYADGLLFSRQQQARLQSQDCVLVSGSIYDFSGRPTLTPLGAPVNQNKFNYVPELYTSGGELYRAEHFDADANYDSPSLLDGGPVADYWSSVNPDTQIPSADSLAFARTLFYPEASGRVQEQSGPGLTHSLYGGRTVKTIYSNASERELVSVFGDEAPYVNGVTRVLSIDQNNVPSIQYIEKEGRVLATCLLYLPANDSLLLPLDHETLAEDYVNALTIADTVKVPTSYASLYNVHGSRKIYLNEQDTITLRYSISPRSLDLECQDFCRTCDYRIIRSFRRTFPTDSTLLLDTLVIDPAACPAVDSVFADVEVNASPGIYTMERWVLSNRNDTLSTAGGDVVRPIVNAYCDTVRSAYAAVLRDTLNAIFGESYLNAWYHPDSTKSGPLYDSLLKRYLQYYADLDSTKILPIDTCCSIWLPPSSCINGCDPPVNFEEYMFDQWRDSLGLTQDSLNYYFRDREGLPKFSGAAQDTGLFNTIVAGMQAEGYDCYQLWRCWQNQIDMLPGRMFKRDTATLELIVEADTLVYQQGFDLLEGFLDCAGRRLSEFSSSPYGSNGYLDYPWRIYPQPDAGCLSAMNYIPLGNAGDTLWHLSVTTDSAAVYANHENLYRCYLNTLYREQDSTRYVNEFGGEIPDFDCGGQDFDDCLDSLVAIMIDSCEARCEARREAFRDSLAYAFAYDGIVVQRVDSLGVNYSDVEITTPVRDTISAYEFNCLADMLVGHCNDQCQLTVNINGSNIESVGTAEEIENYTNARYSPFFKIRLPEACGDCPDAQYYRIVDSTYTDTTLLKAIDTLNCHLQQIRDTMTNEFMFWKYYDAYFLAAGVYGPLYSCLPDTAALLLVHRDVPTRFRREQIYDPGTQTTSCRLVYSTPLSLVDNVDAGEEHALITVLNNYLDSAWGKAAGADSFTSVDSASTEFFDPGGYYTWKGGSYASPALDPLHHEWDTCYNDSSQMWEYCDHFLTCINGQTDPVPLTDVVDITSHTTSRFRRDVSDSVEYILGTYEFSFYGAYDSADVSIRLQYGDRSGENMHSIDLIFEVDGRVDTCRFNSTTEKYELSALLDTTFRAAVGYFRSGTEGGLEFYVPGKDWSYAIGTFTVGCQEPCDVRQEICSLTCDTLRCDRICFKWDDEPDVDADEMLPKSCAQLAVETLIPHLESQLFDVCLQEATEHVKESYKIACGLPASLQDEFIAEYGNSFHHYTLYYYDRAGNLIKTIPPKGVDLAHSDTLTRNSRPNHTLATTYEYNSLGQLVKQTTPDGGATDFWYNAKGQLRLSQNAEQALNNDYSYTRYDGLGRIVEVGQTTILTGAEQDSADLFAFPQGGVEQITQTTYTTAASPTVSYPATGQNQQYLRNRVSWTLTDHDGNTGTTSDQVRTVYSYDAHGNVVWLMQDLPGLGETFVHYDYDLISGRVKEVVLREGAADEFRYRYRYDDDGRLICAESSSDGVIWEEDAKYAYYAHGPLRRVELGDDRIQGVDYTYTIQGWLKAINHPAPDPTNAPSPGPAYDPGGDGDLVAADAYGMALGYFPGDFTNYASGNSPFNQSADWTLNGNPLYNGNISSWTGNIMTSGQGGKQFEQLTGYTYRYDLLNRIKRARFNSWNSVGDTFDLLTDYSAHFGYDPNGNLDTLKRWGSGGTQFDNFLYHYTANSNKLSWVTDNVVSSALVGDIEGGQGTNNYTYDAIGNLTADVQEGISDIDWTAYGKIRSVEETDSTQIIYTYDAAGNRILKQDKRWNGSSFALDKETWYIRDAAGTVLSQYEKSQSGDTTTTQTEVPLYGSKRLGLFRPEQDRWATVPSDPLYTRYVDERQFELSDHLGNVRAVVGDVRLPVSSRFIADLKAYNNYYPFGMLQTDRSWASESYRYGFNGMEMDNEVKGEGNSYDFGARMYDSRLGKWLSLDALASSYPGISPYTFALNTPIQAVDPDGNVVIFVNGLHGGSVGGKPDYWRKGKLVNISKTWWKGVYRKEYTNEFDKKIMSHVGDDNARYYDGALGGGNLWRNNRSWSSQIRREEGRLAGVRDAADIIANLERNSDGEIIETIKIVTHSMGSAYGEGFAAGLIAHIEANPEETRGARIAWQADFAPYQSDELRAIRESAIMGVRLQLSHLKDWAAGNAPIPGAEPVSTEMDKNQGHSIFSFDPSYRELPKDVVPGTEPWENTSYSEF